MSTLTTRPRYKTRGVLRKWHESHVHEYKGREQRLVRTTCADGHVLHYAGAKGQERRVRIEFRGGTVFNFKGPKGKEFMWRQAWANAWVNYYEKVDGGSILVRRVYSDDTVEYFKRVKGQKTDTVRSRKVFADGSVMYFKGNRPSHERMVRLEVPPEAVDKAKTLAPYGTVSLYEGECGRERLVCKEVSTEKGTELMYFEGSKGVEKVVRVDKPDGTISYFDDDGIHIDCIKWPNGKMAHYTGDVGSSLWCVDHADGRIDYFEENVTDLDDDDPDAPWNVRDDCWSNPIRQHTHFPNGDEFYYCPYNGDRVVIIYRKAQGRELRRAEVLWHRVREWFRTRAIVLHWQEQTQMRLAAPGGAGRSADYDSFVADFGVQ